MLAVDPHTGDVLWSKEYLNGHHFEYLGYDEGTNRLYAANANRILAFNPEDGTQVLTTTVDSYYWVGPFTIADGNLYAPTISKLVKIDQTGNIVWTFANPWGNHGMFTTPSVGDGRVYIGDLLHWELFAIDANTGQLVWTARTNGAPYTTPVVGDGLVFQGCQGQGIYSSVVLAYNAYTGDIEWGVATGYGGTVNASMSYAGGILYFGSLDQFVYAVDTRARSILWEYETPCDIDSSVVLLGDIVYTMSCDTLWALDAKTGELIWHQEQIYGAKGGLVPYEGVLLINTRILDIGTTLQALSSDRGFRMHVEPDSKIVMVGEQSNFSIRSYATYNFTETLQFSISQQLAGIDVSFTPTQVLPSEIATTTVSISPNVSTTGWITLTIEADTISGAKSESINVFVAKSSIYLPVIDN